MLREQMLMLSFFLEEYFETFRWASFTVDNHSDLFRDLQVMLYYYIQYLNNMIGFFYINNLLKLYIVVVILVYPVASWSPSDFLSQRFYSREHLISKTGSSHSV